jgi:hypothetical protein
MRRRVAIHEVVYVLMGFAVFLVLMLIFGKAPTAPNYGLPATVPSAFGTVQITTADTLMDGDTPLYGRAHLPQLHIQIRKGMAPGFAQYVLDHEICHIALLETPIPEEAEEAVCDAIARQRAAERR